MKFLDIKTHRQQMRLEQLVFKKLYGKYLSPSSSFTYTAYSDVLIDKISPFVGNWKSGDGFLTMDYGEFANHDCDEKKCFSSWVWYELAMDKDDSEDYLPWSCHIKLGMIGKETCPEHWKHGQRFCARGRTMAHAVCLAFLKSMEKAKKPLLKDE